MLNSTAIQTLHSKLPTDRSKVLIAGFFGAKNLGDELMLHSMIKAIRTVDSVADITILLADNYRPDILDYQPHRTIHYPKNTADLAELSRNYDCIIFSGGALIDDSGYSSEKMSLERLVIELGSLFISNGKRCALYGVSTAHTLTNQNYITKLAYIIDNSYHVSVRDTFSLATLKAAKIDTSSVNVVDDIVFADNIFNTIDSSQKKVI